jgi:hypothetical protein
MFCGSESLPHQGPAAQGFGLANAAARRGTAGPTSLSIFSRGPRIHGPQTRMHARLERCTAARGIARDQARESFLTAYSSSIPFLPFPLAPPRMCMAPPAFLPIMPARHVLEARMEAPGAADTPMPALPIDGREPSTAQSAAMADIATTVRGPNSIDRIKLRNRRQSAL